MKPINQEDDFGCAVACIAFILNISYKETLGFFKDGQERVKNKANFYCPELVNILNSFDLNYDYEKINKINENKIYKEYSIVFIGKNKKYRYGHFLCRYNGLWMDSWINFPDNDRKAGFRKRLPEKPIYFVYKST